MVAELVARQQSGSPINGETPNQNHTNSNMPTNGHNQNIMNNSNSNARNGNHRPAQHPHIHNLSRSSSPTSYLHDSHSNLMMIGNGPMSPNSQDGFPAGYDIAAHAKRKELFTQRKQREFIPDNKKDDSYWDRRRRNNEAAKRSREKRRYNDMILEQRVVELTKENYVLKAQLDAIKDKYNITGENLVNIEQIMATIPTVENVLSITKRAKLGNNAPLYPQSPSPSGQTSVIHQPISIESPPMQSSQQPQSQQLQPQHQQHSSSISPQLNSSPHHHSIHHSNHHYPLGDVNMTVLNSASPIRSSIIENPNRSELYRSNSVIDRDSFHSNENGSLSNNINGNINGNGNYRYVPYGTQGSMHHSEPHHTQSYESELANRQLSNGSSKTNVIVGNRRDELNAHDDDASTNVLNLSRRRNGIENAKKDGPISRNNGSGSGSCPTSPYEVSSGTGSSTASGDDEQCCDNQPLCDTNNSLPLKLRHKSHLGDKDAATALLALQHIKQEPNSRLSPTWDGEGSSDERDSGISIGAPEWGIPRKLMIPPGITSISGIGGIGAALAANLGGVGVVGGLPLGSVLGVSVNGNGPNMIKDEQEVHLKSQIARLESEVASIKNMMTLNRTAGSATTVQ